MAEVPHDARHNLRMLQATAFVSTLDRFAMPPMLLAIAHDLDASLASIVHAAGLYFLVYGLSQPLWGLVSDRYGRVRTMRGTLLLAGLFGLASAATWSPLGLAVARGLAGGLFGAAYPSTLIYLGDTVPARLRQRQITNLMVGVALGTALASAGAGLLADALSWRVAFIVTGVAAVSVSWWLRGLPEPTSALRPPSPFAGLRMVGRSRTAMLVLALAFLEGAVLLGALTLLPPAIQETGASATVAGVAIAAYGVAVLVFSQLVGRLSQRWHPARLIMIGAVAAVSACALYAAAPSTATGLVASALIALGWTAMHSSLQTWATEVIPAARASVVSLFAGSLFVGSAVAAVLVAGLADHGRYSTIFLAYACAGVPLGVVATLGRRAWRRPGESTPWA